MIGRWIERLGLNSRWIFVSLVTLVYWFGPQSVRLFYPLQLHDLGASDLVIGLAVGAASMAGLVLAVPSGYLLDRFNSHHVLVVTTLGLSATTGSFVWAHSIVIMIVLMVLQGLFQMWVWLVLQAMISRAGVSPPAIKQVAIFSIAWGIGMAAGPSVGAWIYDMWGFNAVSTACGFFSLVGTVGALLVPRTLRRTEPRPEDVEHHESQKGMLRALRRSFNNPIVFGVMVSSFVTQFVLSLRLSFYPLFLQQGGVSVGTIGLLLSAIGVSSLAVRLFLPAVIRNFGMVGPLIWSTWIAILGVSITPVSTNSAVLLIGALMVGVGLGANPPITLSLLAMSRERDLGVSVGLRMVANRSAQTIQPLIFGAMAAAVGLAIAFPASGVLLGATALWMRSRLRSIEEG